eukprot:m.452920 g.452920  ORF g.452920 m.452920 type:complete len:937 (-) comp21543_c0_seq1:201-3011(-)
MSSNPFAGTRLGGRNSAAPKSSASRGGVADVGSFDPADPFADAHRGPQRTSSQNIFSGGDPFADDMRTRPQTNSQAQTYAPHRSTVANPFGGTRLGGTAQRQHGRDTFGSSDAPAPTSPQRSSAPAESKKKGGNLDIFRPPENDEYAFTAQGHFMDSIIVDDEPSTGARDRNSMSPFADGIAPADPLAVLASKLEMNLITQAEYEKLYALHMLMKDMSSPVKRDDVTSTAATAPRRPPGSSGVHLRSQHHATDHDRSTSEQNRPPSDYMLDPDGTAYVDEDEGSASLSPTKQQIFRLSEKERLETLQGVKDGTVSIDSALQCIALGRPIATAAGAGAQYDRHTSQEVREAVLKSAEPPRVAVDGTELPGQARDVTIGPGDALPRWLTAEVLRDELVTCLHENRELLESIDQAESQHEELERVAEKAIQERDKAASIESLWSMRVTRAEAESNLRKECLVQAEEALHKAQAEVIQLRKRTADAEFHRESLSMRNKDLQNMLTAATRERHSLQSELDTLKNIRDALIMAGVDVRELSGEAREEKVRLLLHRAASSKMLSSVDMAIETMDLAPVLDSFVDRLMLGEAVHDVVKEFIVTGNLGRLLAHMAKDGMLGAKVQLLGTTGFFERAAERVGVVLTSQEGTDVASRLIMALGSEHPGADFLDVVRDPSVHEKLCDVAQSGALGERAQLFAATGNMRACIDYAVKLIEDEGVLRTAFSRVERLVKDGTLAMMAQFAGGANTPVGTIVQWLHTCVEDGTMSNLESALVGLCTATAPGDTTGTEIESNDRAENVSDTAEDDGDSDAVEIPVAAPHNDKPTNTTAGTAPTAPTSTSTATDEEHTEESDGESAKDIAATRSAEGGAVDTAAVTTAEPATEGAASGHTAATSDTAVDPKENLETAASPASVETASETAATSATASSDSVAVFEVIPDCFGFD